MERSAQIQSATPQLPTADSEKRYKRAARNVARAAAQVQWPDNWRVPLAQLPTVENPMAGFNWVRGPVSVACVAHRAGEDRVTGLHHNGFGSVAVVLDGHGHRPLPEGMVHPVQQLVDFLEEEGKQAMLALLTTDKPLAELSDLVARMQNHVAAYRTWGAVGTILALRPEGLFGITVGDVFTFTVTQEGVKRISYMEPVESKGVERRVTKAQTACVVPMHRNGEVEPARIADVESGYSLNMASAFGDTILGDALDRKGRLLFVPRAELGEKFRVAAMTDGVIGDAFGDSELRRVLDTTVDDNFAAAVVGQAQHRMHAVFPGLSHNFDDMAAAVINYDD